VSAYPSCAKPRTKRPRTAVATESATAISDAETPMSASAGTSSSISDLIVPPSANHVATSSASAAPTETTNESPSTAPPLVDEKSDTALDEDSLTQICPRSVADDFGRLETPTVSVAMILDKPAVGDVPAPNDPFVRETTPALAEDHNSAAVKEDDLLPIRQVDVLPFRPLALVDTLVNEVTTPIHENSPLNEDANPLIQHVITPPVHTLDICESTPNVHECDCPLKTLTPPAQDYHVPVPEYQLPAVDQGELTDDSIDNDEDITLSH